MGSIRVILAGCLAGVAILFISIIFSFLTGPLYESSPEIWKPVGGDLWFLSLVLMNLLVGLVYAVVYTVLGKSIKGRVLDKGLLYGTLMWFVGPLLIILSVHTTVNIPTEVIISWLFGGLINALVAGVIIAFVFEQLKR